MSDISEAAVRGDVGSTLIMVHITDVLAEVCRLLMVPDASITLNGKFPHICLSPDNNSC